MTSSGNLNRPSVSECLAVPSPPRGLSKIPVGPEGFLPGGDRGWLGRSDKDAGRQLGRRASKGLAADRPASAPRPPADPAERHPGGQCLVNIASNWRNGRGQGQLSGLCSPLV